jgi:putative cardiolipin synthase
MPISADAITLSLRRSRGREREGGKVGVGGTIRRCVIAFCTLAIAGCALPPIEGRTMSSAIQDTEATRLGKGIAPALAEHPEKTGIYALPVPRDAFAARGLLAGAAERSLDAQYYIWHGDHTGDLLYEALWRAAERGVRVRLLLDDNTTAGLDPTIAALDAHPNIEVRLYNPLVNRTSRWSNYVVDFQRVNRRMHNKSFTVDNQATIVGGRNIGDEYFAAGSGVAFADLDVIAVGPAVQQVSKSFDLYWNSPSAYPAEKLLGQASPEAVAQLQRTFAATRAAPEAAQYLESLKQTPMVTELSAGRLALEWTDAQLVYDDPAKTLDTANRKDVLLLTRLLEHVGQPAGQFDLVSPYFVPMAQGTATLQAMAARGVKVRVLTNSLESTDVSAVHAGYAKRRKDLLRAGVQLYELRRAEAAKPPPDKTDQDKKKGGSSSASLHAKTFQIDGERIFVGSFNFDPRSATLNTEMGLLIDSPVLAGNLKAFFDTEAPLVAYEVRLADNGSLQWIERTAQGEKIHDTEPGTTALRRAGVGFMSILPIEWLL